jgi:hypothetical protein
LTTGLHGNSGLGEFLPVIVKALESIGPCTARLSEPWTKFLLDGVPTDANLEDIREDVEQYCTNIQLGQLPRWLANAENGKNKSHSTVVLAFLDSVITSDLLKYSPSSVIVYSFYFSLWLIISLSILVLIMR